MELMALRTSEQMQWVSSQVGTHTACSSRPRLAVCSTGLSCGAHSLSATQVNRGGLPFVDGKRRAIAGQCTPMQHCE